MFSEVISINYNRTNHARYITNNLEVPLYAYSSNSVICFMISMIDKILPLRYSLGGKLVISNIS